MIGAVMPAYNHGKFLAEAIASVEPQVDRLVVVDDASTDITQEVLKGKHHIRLHENKGAANAINVGIDSLRGERQDWTWLTWVSADNIMASDWVSTLLSHAKDNHGAVYGGFQAFPTGGGLPKEHYCFKPYDPPFLGRSTNCYLGPAFLIRAQYWQDHRGKHSHDYDNWLRVEEALWADGKTILGVNKALCRYRMHMGQATRSRKPGMFDAPYWLKQAKTRRKALQVTPC